MSPCPIGAADRRLRDAFHLWGRIEREYFDPYEFRLALNGFIQEARNVTWILQKAKSKVAGFDEWYKTWQLRLQNDPILRWIVESRNRITKQGDLETQSSCIVTFIAGWTEEATIRFHADLFFPAEALVREALKKIPANALVEESLFCIERRWVDRGLPDKEILDATSHALQVLATLVDEAHDLILETEAGAKCEVRWQLKELRDSYPLDLAKADESRKVWMGAQRLEPVKYTISSRRFEKVDAEKMREHYRADSEFEKRADLESLDEAVRFFMYSAKQVLLRDGRALSFLFAFRRDEKRLEVLGLAMEDRVGKHIAMRQAAVVLSRIPVFWALLVGEAWVSHLQPGQQQVRHAVEDPRREEALSVNGVSTDGSFRNCYATFSRVRGTIAFEAERFDSEPTNIMAPIFAAIHHKRG
jgi:hypothetical protein